MSPTHGIVATEFTNLTKFVMCFASDNTRHFINIIMT